MTKPIYVRGSGDAAWHWCENCRDYPAELAGTSPSRPRGKLCEQCETLERAGDCDACS
jgi:hypothetical protein